MPNRKYQDIVYLPAYRFCSKSGVIGVCELRVLCPSYAKLCIVELTELAGNPGPSVTNAIEELATQVYFEILAPREIDPTEVVWVEHYGPQSFDRRNFVTEQDRYAQAELTWVKPTRFERGRYISTGWRPSKRPEALPHVEC